MIETKDILTWCFTVAALDFGVFGFLYSTYAAASFQADPARPPITRYLRLFCRVVTLILLALTLIALVTAYSTVVNWQTWAIILCFVVLTTFSLVLAYKME
jgi:hypothetical protein